MSNLTANGTVPQSCNVHDVEPTDGVATVANYWCNDCNAPAQFDEVFVSELNGEEVTYYPEFAEFVCSGCGLNCDPAGHTSYDCREASWDYYSTRD